MELKSPLLVLLLLLLLVMVMTCVGFGAMGPLSAAFADNGFFCAIDASGKQEIFCWKKDNSSSSASAYFSSLPSMVGLSGGEGFMCGIVTNTSYPYCWNSVDSGTDLVPLMYRNIAYSHIAAGKNHVCALAKFYSSLDCWPVDQTTNNTWESEFNSPSLVPNITSLVSGVDFSCGVVTDGSILCWGGPNSKTIGVSPSINSDKFLSLASSRDSICGISKLSGQVKCWGDPDSFGTPPFGIPFVALSGGSRHFCGIRQDDHGIECWGDHDPSSIPQNSGFLAIASSDFTTCGVRESDLILDCWNMPKPLAVDYSPPLQLCSPGLCTSASCGEGMFTFNASILSVPDLTSLCLGEDLRICSPCGSNCSTGFFTSSVCGENADRVCTACSLCQNSSCWDTCGISYSFEGQQQRGDQHYKIKKLAIIIGSSVSGFMLVVIGWCLFRCATTKKKEDGKNKSGCCIRKPEVEVDIITEPHLPLSRNPSVGIAQVFRLSELKDATNGFKEFNEIGRGSYGFVYKAILSDGQQVAVKRANASTIIHTSNRDFEAELEILCSIRHGNIVNLIGYCTEMGERLLVYEFMPHGTLHDHLHGGLSCLNWNLRLKISLQTAKGLKYLHKGVVPPIVHHDIKPSNILLDSEWGGRIADFGLMSRGNKDQKGNVEDDVYKFGIVLLEIISGRKAYDNECTPPGIVEWAVPLIKQGKAAAIIDRNVSLPRNVEPLLKLAEIAELAVKEVPKERASMSDIVMWLEQIIKSGSTL